MPITISIKFKVCISQLIGKMLLKLKTKHTLFVRTYSNLTSNLKYFNDFENQIFHFYE